MKRLFVTLALVLPLATCCESSEPSAPMDSAADASPAAGKPGAGGERNGASGGSNANGSGDASGGANANANADAGSSAGNGGNANDEPQAAGGRDTNGGSNTDGPNDNDANGGMNASGGSGMNTGGSGMNTDGGPTSDEDALGAHPFAASPVTRGGTMTFTNVGAAGWWPRRIERAAGDPACDYKDGTDTWGAQCCMKRHETTSTTLSPFDEEMTLLLKAIEVKQLAIYQPRAPQASYERVSFWDPRLGVHNLWFTQNGDGSAEFPGDFTKNDCVGYLMQAPRFDCGDGHDYYCPDDPGVLHQGFAGSKLVVFLGSMTFDDANVEKCDGDGAGHPGPWVAFVASELTRDGGRKWNGACNCYSKTGSVGDGCGEINVFEVVMDDNDFSNREFASTGVRSFQVGHIGGAVCQSSCRRDDFAEDIDLVDACAQQAYDHGPTLVAGGDSDGCPVWRRPIGDRYFFILLDQSAHQIQVGVVHPANIPAALAKLLPELPATLTRSAIDDILELRLPE